MKPWDKNDFEEIIEIIRKYEDLRFLLDFFGEKTRKEEEKLIFLTGFKRVAVNYAIQQKSEVLHRFLGMIEKAIAINNKYHFFTPPELRILRRIYEKYLLIWKEARPVLLHISIKFYPHYIII